MRSRFQHLRHCKLLANNAALFLPSSTIITRIGMVLRETIPIRVRKRHCVSLRRPGVAMCYVTPLRAGRDRVVSWRNRKETLTHFPFTFLRFSTAPNIRCSITLHLDYKLSKFYIISFKFEFVFFVWFEINMGNFLLTKKLKLEKLTKKLKVE